MLINLLDQSEKRQIITCNYNQHINSKHADRVLDMHDLVYIREGEWSITQDGIDYSVKQGDIILLQSGHHHYGTIPCNGIVKTMFIHFASHKNDCLCECKERKSFYSFPVVAHCGEDPAVENYFKRIIAAFWEDGPYGKVKASAYLDLLLCAASSIGANERSLADEIKKMINKNPGRFIPNEEFAQALGCSVRTVTSKFKENTGTSPHAWQMEQKCRIADELIRNEPTLTLKEVAATYGFYDEYHFGKCFKKIMGRSPKSASRFVSEQGV